MQESLVVVESEKSKHPVESMVEHRGSSEGLSDDDKNHGRVNPPKMIHVALGETDCDDSIWAGREVAKPRLGLRLPSSLVASVSFADPVAYVKPRRCLPPPPAVLPPFSDSELEKDISGVSDEDQMTRDRDFVLPKKIKQRRCCQLGWGDH